jgi:hypothetical protein
MADKKRFRIDIGRLNKFWGSPSEFRYGFTPSGVFHSFLFGRLGQSGALDYIGQLKREWGADYNSEIEDLVQEAPIKPKAPPPPPPPSPQTEFEFTPQASQEWISVQAFLKDTNKDHPGALLADNWKSSKKMEFVTFDQLKDKVGVGEVVFSAKMDGELVCLWFENGRAETVTAKGTIRTGMPAVDEAQEIMAKKFKSAAFMGELYAVDENNRPISYMQAASVLKDPDLGRDDAIRLAIFDVVEVEGKSAQDMPIADRMALIAKTFEGGKYVYPAYTKKGTIQDIEALWNELEKKGLEGVVVHMSDGTILKSKPIMSFDLMLVAVTKSPSIPGRIGAILASFIDKEGRYRLAGHIGTGMRDDQRVEFMNLARQYAIAEDDQYIWIDPKKSPVIEVEAVEVNPKKTPAMEFQDGHYVEIEKMMSGTLRFPVLKQVRTDKDPKYPDVRVEQLPFKLESASMLREGMKVMSLLGHTGTIVGLVPDSGDSGWDYDIIVKWDEPVWGIEVSEVHPTEIQMVGVTESQVVEVCVEPEVQEG